MENAEAEIIDVDAYLERIGIGDRPPPSLASLARVQRAHATTIPFENLDILLGRPIRIDVPSVFDKLVTQGRGGYCFEQNTLFAAALAALGFSVTRLSARVAMGAPRATPRPLTHMLLAVDLDGGRWVADVGFGAAGIVEPVALEDLRESHQGGWTFRTERYGDGWILEILKPAGWLDLYRFTEHPQAAVDYEVANHFTSTHPSSPFTQMVTAQLSGTDVQLTLRGEDLVESFPNGDVVTSKVEGDEALLDVLRGRFGLAFPPGTIFRPPAR